MKKTIILLFITTVIASGCKKFLDVNNNPNSPVVVTPNVVLSAALTGTAGNVGTDFLNVNRYMGYWSRSGNFVSDPINEEYQFNNSMTDGDWSNIYTTLNRYNYIYGQGKATKQPFYVGVAQVMEAFHFATLVDVYGDVPYTQAFDPLGHQQPKYDDAATIYTALIAKLDSAIDTFEAAKVFYATAPSTTISVDDQYDLLYGKGAGVDPSVRMTSWETLDNTIKLKLLLHEYKVATSSYVTTEIGKITANGAGYIGVGQSAVINPGYEQVTGKINPFYGLFYTTTATNNDQSYYRANTYAINFYALGSDERANFFYGAPFSASTAGPIGNYDGDPQSQPNAVTSQISGDGNVAAFGSPTLTDPGILKDFTQDQLIMSDFESLFIQAEASFRGWITGSTTTATYYKEAVEQSFRYLNAGIYGTGDPKDDADDYLAGNGNIFGESPQQNVTYAASSDKLQCIMTQKWAALNGINWVEAWTDYRRTGFPNSSILGISKAATHIQNQIPTRYLYPQSELNTNASNVPVLAAPAQFDPIFWAQ